jgi:hypothetical protein
MKRILILIGITFASMTFGFGSDPINAQSKGESLRKEAVNTYVDFVNESIHGLLIINRLFQGYNEDINKYVDLEEYQLNLYSNKDLPRDIYEDEEKWFYEVSPNQLYKLAIEKADVFSTIESNNLKRTTAELKKILEKSNSLRFEIEQLIRNLNLEKRENIGLVYQKLEEGATLYKSFFSYQMELESELKKITRSWVVAPDSRNIMNTMDDVYNSSKNILLAVRNEGEINLAELIAEQEKALQKMQSISLDAENDQAVKKARFKRSWKNTLDQLGKSIEASKKYSAGGDIIPEYKYYGKNYYYYNSEIIGRFNKYGLGMVQEMNKMMEMIGGEKMKFIELPHLFKVIYPNKIEEIDYIFAKQGLISTVPEKIAERKIKQAKNSIIAENAFLELELYDHFIEDGDTVSINFNGEWIVENMALTQKPKKVKLLLNNVGKNYLSLHAVNLGSRPPNTMAIKYTYRGQQKEIILNSDMKESELIEIEYRE